MMFEEYAAAGGVFARLCGMRWIVLRVSVCRGGGYPIFPELRMGKKLKKIAAADALRAAELSGGTSEPGFSGCM